MAHRWHFFRAGGVDQVSLRDGADLAQLAQLDHKLWVALAMPTRGVDVDPETLDLLDPDKDGRIRVQDILAAIAFARTTFKDPDDILTSASEVQLSALSDAKVIAAAKRMLSDLAKPDAALISVADATAISKAFTDTVLNGDGIVIPASTDDLELRKVIEDAIACVGSATDRSGKPGIDTAHAETLWKAVDERAAWLAKGADPALSPIGAATVPAADAVAAVHAKLEDFFTRCRIAAFDPRGAAALGGQDAELLALGTRTLTSTDEELAKLPLARIEPAGRLTLTSGINPAWADRIAAFVEQGVKPLIGARDVLVPSDLAAIDARLATFEAWRAAKPTTVVDGLEESWIRRLATPALREQLAKLIAADAALADEYAQITSVARAVRMQRDFGRILRNFVNFSDFYSKQDGLFQAGTLYLDARAMHLCVPVTDAARHATLATSSDSYLVYCEIKRGAETQQIAAALTNGDADNMFIGRNGVFYDRKGQDWDATVTKLVSNPISIREAFWSPYKKLVRMIEDNITRRAVAADAKAATQIDGAAKDIAHVDQAVPEPPATPKKIDLGTVAAIGVAIGGIGTLVGALLAAVFGLGPWLPVGLIVIFLMISGPAMVLAYLKLRRRNLGPILDANGWAINGRARINVTFGAAMTELARVPPGSLRTLDDPFADKRTPWRRWVFLAIIVVLGGSWYVGKLDKYLPEAARSTEVLGSHAPTFVKPAAAPAPAATPVPAPAPAPTPAPK